MSSILIGLGVALVWLGALGVVLLPDLYLRLHASTKCTFTGSTLTLIGLALRAWSWDMAARLLAIVLFLFLTSPMVPHVIACAFAWETHERARR